jgi:peptidoglycan/xylan/chitin deacetylase (PgdA/CDA1 family)
MYHSVGDPPMKGALGRLIRRHGLSIAPDLLRKHLQTLYDGGFYPVNMRDLLSPRLDIPAGKTPVVLTFDDARTSQFRYRKDGSIDPNCVVGILEAFHRKHPDWPERASFYVLPESSINPAPFGNQRQVKKKLDYLVAHGYEIANHSTTHHPMRHMDARALSWEMATCTAYFRKVEPRATMDTMALPYGIAPRKALLPVLLNDGKGGGGYRNRCILLAAGNPSYAPADKRFDRLGVMRVGSDPGNIEHWIKVLTAQRTAAARTGAGYAPYVSDGDPNTLTVPQPLAKYVNQSSLEGVRVVYTAPPRKATHVAKRN